MENQESINDLEMETCKRKSNEIKEKYEKIIEKLEAEKAILAEIFSNKKAEISDMKSRKHEEMIVKKKQLDEEFAGRLSKVQMEHDIDLMERDLLEHKLAEDKKNLDRDIDNEKKAFECRLKQQSQEFQETLKDKIREVIRKWEIEVHQFEEKRSWTELALKNFISCQAYGKWKISEHFETERLLRKLASFIGQNFWSEVYP